MSDNKLHVAVFDAHAGDAELTTGGLIANYTKDGHEVTIVHLTLREKGHPHVGPDVYAEQKTKEAKDAAKVLKADVRFMPYKDGELPISDEVKFRICDLIREIKPDIVITHWKGSWHKDHANTYYNMLDGIFYAALPAIKRKLPVHGIRSLFFAENWEDRYEFQPQIYIDISEVFETYVEAISKFAVIRGEVVSFPYLKYVKSLAAIRGAESNCEYAETFMIPKNVHCYMLSKHLPLSFVCKIW